MAFIANAALKNKTSRSSVARLLLRMIEHIPAELLRETSPVPEFFGIRTGTGGTDGHHVEK
jgi:hypothetical protein